MERRARGASRPCSPRVLTRRSSALLQRDARPILAGLPRIGALAAGTPTPRPSALADPERRQPRALEALLRWLGRVAAERPIVLALEDLQVADAATRAFATFLARTAREERLCLVLTWQPDRLTREHPLRENLAVIEAGLRPPVRVNLAPLSRREIAALIEGIEGERPSASVVVLVAERSAGSPLVVEELIAARRELRHVSLTGTLSDLIAARLARRSPECRRVLRLLAPSQRPMDRTRLAIAAAPSRSSSPPGRSRHARRRGRGAGRRASTRTSPRASRRRSSTGSCASDDDERLGSATSSSRGPSSPTCCRPSDRGTGRRSPAGSRTCPVVAAYHWRAAYRPAEAREAAMRRRRLALAVEAPLDALDAFEFGLELPPPVRGPARRRVRPGGPGRRSRRRRSTWWRSSPRRRPPPPAGPRVPSPTRRARSRRSASARTACSTRSSRHGSAATGWPPATRRARPRRCVGPPTSPRPGRPWSGHGSSPCSPRSGCSPARSARPRRSRPRP